MDIAALAASLLRRWYVVVVGVLVTAGLGVVAMQAVPPTYTAAGSVLLLPPSAAVDEGSNQLLQLGGLEQPASLVVAYLAGDNVRTAFDAKNPGVTYDVVLDPLSRGPLIMMTVHSPSSDTVMDALDSALATVPDALDALQDQVAAPQASRFTSMPLSVDAKPTTVNKETLRALIAAVGVGVALTLVGAVGLDSLLVRRRRRAAKATAAAARAAAAGGPADDEGPGAAVEPAPMIPADDLEPLVPPTYADLFGEPDILAAPKDTRSSSSTRRLNTEWIPVTRDDATSGAGAPHVSPRT